MTQFYSTKEVARLLEIKPDTLSRAIWQDRVKSPQKSPGGQFLWTDSDIEKAAWALNRGREFKLWLQADKKGGSKCLI